jgi:hypothetical protein
VSGQWPEDELALARARLARQVTDVQERYAAAALPARMERRPPVETAAIIVASLLTGAAVAYGWLWWLTRGAGR